jgi:methylmalonyl-CoA/ethylmalonyl-CoA epimerase
MLDDYKVMAQVALVVKDADKIAKAFAEVLGVEVPEGHWTDPLEKANTRFKGEPSIARAKLVFFQFDNIQLELIEPDGNPSTWQQFLDEHGQGVHHIAFKVKDMEKEIVRLEGLGLQLEQRGDYTGGEYAYLNGEEKIACIFELLADK